MLWASRKDTPASSDSLLFVLRRLSGPHWSLGWLEWPFTCYFETPFYLWLYMLVLGLVDMHMGPVPLCANMLYTTSTGLMARRPVLMLVRFWSGTRCRCPIEIDSRAR